MKNTFCVRFYCRPAKIKKGTGKAPVEVSLIIRGERQMWQLPKSCEPEKFKTLKPNSDVKIYCLNVENKLNSIYTALTLADEPISAFIVKDIFINGSSINSYTLRRMEADGLKVRAAENCHPTLYRKYEIAFERFLRLTGLNPDREAGSVTHSDILIYRSGLEKELKPQTVKKEIERARYFFLLALNNGRIKSNPFFKVKYTVPQEPNVFLTQEEVGRIRELRITNYRLDKIRDTFLFMCYSGLEFADMEHLVPEDVKETEQGQLYIKKRRVKTGVEYISILYEDAIQMFHLYDGVLPLCSNQKFNVYLKELAKAAGIEKNVTTLTARHTYATYLLSEKHLSLDVVSKMLGHTNSKQTKTYAELLDTTVFDANAESGRITRRPTNYTLGNNPYISDEELEEFQKLFE